MITLEQARKLRRMIERLSVSLSDKDALEVTELFPFGKSNPMKWVTGSDSTRLYTSAFCLTRHRKHGHQTFLRPYGSEWTIRALNGLNGYSQRVQ